jgi:D-lactate dehydrogenase (cytochrome)
VLGLEVILPDGRQIKTGRPVVKNVAGYDMTKLFIGSLGSLGMITEVTFKLVSKPRARKSMVIAFDSLEQSLEIGRELTRICMTASSLIICKNGVEIFEAPYQIIYTAEGYPDNVTAELKQVQEIINRSKMTGHEIDEHTSGTEIWANWIRTKTQKSSDSIFSTDRDISPLYGENREILHIGIPPENIIPFLTKNIKELDASDLIIDLPNGMCYLEVSSFSESLSSEVSDQEGYVKRITDRQHIFPNSGFRNYKPESQKLMRSLINMWDPARILNTV